MEKTRHKGILRIASNKYLVRVKRTDPRTGRRREVKRRVSGRIADALDERNQLLAEVAEGRPERVTLRTYARSWLSTRLPSLKPSTRSSYADALELHILPALGDYWIDALRPADVRRFVTTQSRKLGAWTVGRQLRTLRTIARDAVADRHTDVYFCDRVQVPKPAGYTEEDPNLLSAAELGKLLAEIPPQWYAAAMVAATTGLRWGELSGLRWEDIDEGAGVIRVRRTNWKGIATAPKTRGSTRTVPLLPEAAEALRGHRRRLMAAQNRGLAAGWVFPTAEGTLHKGSPFGKVLRAACKRAGITKRLTPHGLRRTFNDIVRRYSRREVLKAITGHVTESMVEHYSLVDAAEKSEAAAGVLRLARSGTSGGMADGPTSVSS